LAQGSGTAARSICRTGSISTQEELSKAGQQVTDRRPLGKFRRARRRFQKENLIASARPPPADEQIGVRDLNENVTENAEIFDESVDEITALPPGKLLRPPAPASILKQSGADTHN
jgi:hypothetical protein